MTKWSKAHPHIDCALVARADMILNEVTQFVLQHPRKGPKIDPREQALRSAVVANPRSPYALHDLAAYMGDKEMRGAHKALRQFRRNAHQRGKIFFQSLRMWLLTPFRTSSPQPTEGSARRHLPHFCGDPLAPCQTWSGANVRWICPETAACHAGEEEARSYYTIFSTPFPRTRCIHNHHPPFLTSIKILQNSLDRQAVFWGMTINRDVKGVHACWMDTPQQMDEILAQKNLMAQKQS